MSVELEMKGHGQPNSFESCNGRQKSVMGIKVQMRVMSATSNPNAAPFFEVIERESRRFGEEILGAAGAHVCSGRRANAIKWKISYEYIFFIRSFYRCLWVEFLEKLGERDGSGT